MRTFYALFITLLFSFSSSAQATLSSDNFESNSFGTWNSDDSYADLYDEDDIDNYNCDVLSNTVVRLRGNNDLNDKTLTSSTYDLSGYSSVTISYDYFVDSMDNGNEGWELEFFNGTSWETVKSYRRSSDFNNRDCGPNDDETKEEVTLLASDFDFNTQNKFRLYVDTTGGWDFLYVDHIVVTAIGQQNSECDTTGSLLMERYDNIEGVSISSLTNSSNFPNNPSSTTTLNTFEIPTDVADYYGARVSGYLTAPETGNYRFWIAGDDYAELWLSTDNNPNNKTRIAFHNGWTTSREWDKYSSQKSASINLTAGETYYIEALMKEHAGGDNLAVGWAKPGQANNAPSEVIPGSVLSLSVCDENANTIRTAELFFEDFEDENNNATDGEDAYGTFWTAETFGEDPRRFQVRSSNGNRYFESDAARGEETWFTEPITITNFEDLKLSASIDFYDLENNDEEDFIEFSYQVDGGAIVEVATLQGSGSDGNYTWNLSGVTGNTIELLIRFSSDHRDEGHRVDNITLEGTDMNPRVYVYDNDAWSPNDPSGESIMVDEIIIRSGNTILNTNTEANTITVKPGAGLSIPNGVTVTLAEQMTLESASDSYSSLILDGVIEGTVNYERYVNVIGSGSTGGNDLVTAPLHGQRFEDFAAANEGVLAALNNIRAFAPFNNSAGAYQNYNVVTDADTPVEAGKGYRAATLNGATLTFSGEAQSNAVNVAITTENGGYGKWNLIGNPYPSYISIADFLNHVGPSGQTNLEVLAENSTAIYGYDGFANDGWHVINLANMGDKLLAPGQGFFVATDSNATIEFTPSMRRTGNTDDFIAGRTAEIMALQLMISAGNNHYKTDFYFNDNASEGLDMGYDAQTWGGQTSNFMLYSRLLEGDNGIPMAIQALNTNQLSQQISIPLGVHANAGEQLTFSISESTLPSHVEVYLEDTVANTMTLLNNADYILTPSTPLSGTGRFYLKIGNSTLSADTFDADNGLKIYTPNYNNDIVVSGLLNQDTTAFLYDVNGRQVAQASLSAHLTENRITTSTFAPGIYIVVIDNGTQHLSQKVILK